MRYMKAIVGVDTTGTYEPALRLFARLNFPNSDLTLFNAADLVFPYTSFGVPVTVDATNQFVDGLQEAGEAAVAEAKVIAESYGLSVKTKVKSGPCVLMLLDQAEAMGADLIALASTRKGALATFFSGSMSRSIVTSARVPILVGKEGIRNEGPVDAVLATDHSAYVEKAIDQLLQFAPKGIGKIHVVTAYEVSSKEAELFHANLPAIGNDIDQFIREKAEERCKALVGKLAQHGYDADYSLVHGDPNRAISDAMAKTQSELLIMGAQGHGFIDRLFVGSVSFHQLVAEPHSVLILRN